MNQYEILNYFLSVGTSFRKSMDWKKQFVGEDGKSKVKRSGKFGIGVLAAFLLGDEIEVETKSLNNGLDYSFNASIDSQFINVTKKSTLEDYGVTISIVIDNNKRAKLLNGVRNYPNKILWTQWFIYDEPEVFFILDEEKIARPEVLDLNNFFNFKTSDFENIYWRYLGDHKYYNSSRSLLACNGIVINNNYQASTYRENGNILLIDRKPSLIINDKEGILPLKLDRNELDSSEFPFEEELLTEVSKFYIAQILNLKVDRDKVGMKVPIFENAILYGNKGFIIDCDFFIEGIKENYKFVRILYSSNILNLNFQNYSNTFFYFLKEKIQLSYQESNVSPNSGARILLRKTKFDSLFTNENNRLNKKIKKNIVIDDITNGQYVVYETNKFNLEKNNSY
jgi:hypothetical protein